MDRIQQIHELLQAKRFPNSKSLAREFEVVSRTVKRDIEFMKSRMNLPIGFNSRRNGYYYTRQVKHLPHLPMSESEVFSLLVAHKAIAQYRGTPFEQPLENAFRRLTAQLDRTIEFTVGSLDEVLSFHPFAPGDADLETFEILTRALRQQRELGFRYRNHGAPRFRRRRVQPYHLACIQNVWYLLAFDVERRAMRTFALTRFKDAEILPGHFAPPKDFDPDEYLSGSFTVYKGREDHEVVIDFDSWAADEIRGRRWHPSQQVTELRGGALRLRLRLNNLEEIENWVLSMGSHARVVNPKALAERMRKAGESLVKRYSVG